MNFLYLDYCHLGRMVVVVPKTVFLCRYGPQATTIGGRFSEATATEILCVCMVWSVVA